MTQYLCKVGTTSGDIEELTFDSNDEPSLRRDLVEKGYHVFWVRRSLGLGSLSPLLRTGRHRIKTQEFTVFNQELSALLKAGLPLLQSLNIMLERMRNPLFRRVLTDIREKVKSGISLSDAFGWHGDLFPRIYSASLLGGEKSGSLEQVIARYVSYLKLTEGTRKKVVAALVYPAFLFAALIAAAAVLLLHVVPKFAGFFDSFETDLPLLTVVLLTVANTVRANILLILTIVTAAVVVLYFWLQREGSRTVIDGAALRLPFFGPVMHLFATSQLARSLATLLSGGIPLVQSITIAAESIGNRFVGGKVLPVADRVREGKPLASSLEATGQFSNLVLEMVKVGETTGGLAEMLDNVADFSDEEIETRLNMMLALLTPALLMVMGGFVALILLALYLPLFSIANVAR